MLGDFCGVRVGLGGNLFEWEKKLENYRKYADVFIIAFFCILAIKFG